MAGPRTGFSAANVLLSLVAGAMAFTACLFVIEAGRWIAERTDSNWHEEGTQFDAGLGWSPIPAYSGVFEWGASTRDSHGFRSFELAADKPTIFVAGDSVAYGYRLDNRQIASFFLSRWAAPLGWQVANMAVSGYGLDQSCLFLKRNLMLVRKGDVVVLVVCTVNDVFDVSTNQSYGKKKPFVMLMPSGRLGVTGVPISKYCLRNLFSESLFVRSLIRAFPPLEGVFFRWANDLLYDDASAMIISQRILDRYREICESRGASFIVVLAAPLDRDMNDTRPIFDALKKYLMAGGYDFIDFRQNLDAAPDPAAMYRDQVHFSPLGHRWLAQDVFYRVFGRSPKSI